jgi:hypothetical protein
MRAQAYPGEDAAKLKTPDILAPYIVELTSPACTRSGEIVIADDSLAEGSGQSAVHSK